MKKYKSETRKKYDRLRVAKYSLYGFTYVAPLIPSAVILGLNWQEWFKTEQFSVGMGLGMLVITAVSTIVAISKKDKILQETMSALFPVSFILLLWAVTLMFLASVANELGTMLLYTSIGVFSSGISDQVNKKVVKKNLAIYKEAMVESGLDREEQRKEQIKQKALEDFRREADHRGLR